MEPVKLVCESYDTIDEDVRIVHLRIFDDVPVNVMYNHKRNMFNANYLFKQFNADKEKIKQWKRRLDTVELIDHISLYTTSEYHYSYNGNPIWNENWEINPEVYDVKKFYVLKSLSYRTR